MTVSDMPPDAETESESVTGLSTDHPAFQEAKRLLQEAPPNSPTPSFVRRLLDVAPWVIGATVSNQGTRGCMPSVASLSTRVHTVGKCSICYADRCAGHRAHHAPTTRIVWCPPTSRCSLQP